MVQLSQVSERIDGLNPHTPMGCAVCGRTEWATQAQHAANGWHEFTPVRRTYRLCPDCAADTQRATEAEAQKELSRG